MEKRTKKMVSKYRAGRTLQEIGDDYGLTRERIRQLISDVGISAKDGGRAVRHKKRLADIAAELDKRYIKKYGCTRSQYRWLLNYERGPKKPRGVVGAFSTQKHTASFRGIAWKLKLWDWWQIWEKSGRWKQRGRGQGFCMARRKDEGAYEIGNVYITSAIENCSDAPRKKKSTLPIGVVAIRKKFAAHRMINGKQNYLGLFSTPEEAHSVYAAFAPVPDTTCARQ